MKTIIPLLLSLVVLGYQPAAVAVNDMPAYEVSDATPVIFSDKLNLRVLEDGSASKNISEVLRSFPAFTPVSEIQSIQSGRRYWVAQKIHNRLPEALVLRMDPSGWESIRGHVIRADGTVEALRVSGFLYAAHNQLTGINPFASGSRQIESQFTRFTLQPGEKVLLVTQRQANGNLPPKSFVLNFYDELKFSETR